MSLALALLSFTSLGDPVVGLRAGETVVVLDRTLVFDSANVVRSRVLNANTGEPIADVLVEAWTEDGGEPQGIAQCVDRTFSMRDGSIEIECIHRNYRADKVRLSKGGFESSERTVSDLWDNEVSLAPAWPFEGRVLDLDGTPIVGAIVRTRESCAHAVNASKTRTDALGRFRMPDCPTSEYDPEIEILGEHIAPMRIESAAELRRFAAYYGSLDIYAAKRSPVDMRLVDGSGTPMVHRRVVTHEAPMYASWSDEEGVCRLFPPPYGRHETYWISDTGPELTLTALFPVSSTTDVCPFSLGKDHELEARLLVEFEGLTTGEPAPELLFNTEFGGEFAANDPERELPATHGRLRAGGKFEAYAQVDLPLELVKGVNRARIALTKNLLVRTRFPDDGGPRGVIVQAGDDSTEEPNPTKEESDWGFFVPRGAPITFFHESSDGTLRRVQLPALTSETVVDMTAASAILRPGLREADTQTGTIHFVVTDREGKPIEGVEGSFGAGDLGSDFATSADGSFTWVGRAFASYEARFRAPNRASLSFQGSVPSGGATPLIHAVMRRRAHLSLHGAITSVIVPGSDAESVEGGFEFDVAPGSLMVRVLRPDADPLAIELTLAEGETRRLEVR